MNSEFVQGPLEFIGPSILNSLEEFWTSYPAHTFEIECQLYSPRGLL